MGDCLYGKRCKFEHVIADKTYFISEEDWEYEFAAQQKENSDAHEADFREHFGHDDYDYEEEPQPSDDWDQTHAIEDHAWHDGGQYYPDDEYDHTYAIDDSDSGSDIELTQPRPRFAIASPEQPRVPWWLD